MYVYIHVNVRVSDRRLEGRVVESAVPAAIALTVIPFNLPPNFYDLICCISAAAALLP
jgi:hypothetical protein